MLPKVSVLMLTYNRPQFLANAIGSILAQDFQDWELLVIHDGENEEIPRLMEEWQRRDHRILYFHRGIPGNIAHASNFGLSLARGKYIAVLDDDDDWAEPDKLSKQVTFLETHPDHCCCGSGVIVIDSVGREQMRYLKPEKNEDIKRQALLANPLAHSSTIYRAEAAQRVGGYDENLAGFQDWDLCLKLGKIGKLYNFPEYFLHYRVWHGSGSFHQSKRNTAAAVRITRRYRHDYAGFWIAFPMTLLYHAYAYMPTYVHKHSYSFLSQWKKSLFAHRPVPKL